MLRPNRDPCRECGQPVFLAERLMVTSARHLYHRTCFRCARCNSQLTLANYYETEDGRFCCETCPDEEKRFGGDAPLASAPASPPLAAAAAPLATAPLATGDESTTSSSGSSRRPSVTVDTNDLPSNDACERVHSLETEDYAKDQSLSLVQIRRKLFEKDSGQLRVSGAQMSTKQEQPKTDEEKLSEAELKYPAKFAQDVSSEVKEASSQEVSPGCAEVEDAVSEDVSHRSVEVEDASSEDISSKSVEVKDALSEDMPPRSAEVKDASSEDVSSKSMEVKDASSEDIASKSLEVKDTLSEDVPSKSIEVKDTLSEDVTSKSTEVRDESLKAVDVENKPLESRIGLEDTESESKEVDVDSAERSKDVVESREGEPSEVKETEDGPLEKGRGPQEDDPPEPRGDSVADAIKIKVEDEKAPMESGASPEGGLQSDDDKLPKSEDGGGAEVEQESSKDDGAEDKNGPEKEVKSVVPPRPPPPAIQKPPISPRKTSLEASPRKTLPVVAPRAKSPALSVSYPAELNPFAEDEEEEADESVSRDRDDSKDTSNPFGSEEEEEEVTLRKKERPPRPSKPPQRPFTHAGGASPTPTPATTTTPKREEMATSTPVDRRRLIPAPASLNPFWDDGEEPEDDEEDYKSTQTTPQKPPVPKPRTVLSLAPDASPFSDRSNLSRSSGRFGSANSLSSVVSSASTMRRKKHAAPPPPVAPPVAAGPPSANSSASFSPRAPSLSPSAVSVPSSPTLSSGRSTLGRSRKSRPAPKPPGASASNRSTWNPSTHFQPPSGEVSSSTPKSAVLADKWHEGKFNKDEMNRSKQNQLSAGYTADLTEEPAEEPAEDASFHSGDKSSHGQWKRKKGPAPPRPIPQRRQIRAIPLKELKRELDDIEVLQLELERQGVNLETTIRRKFDENPDASESSMTPDIEDLVLQLFELVNEKNELFRKQAELMYLRRQQRLEEEHADLEYQIRVLMEQPERNKTDSDKAKEEKLIQRLVEVVERRNEIVECLEMDRLREAEEDHSIHSRLELFASKSLALNDAYINDLYKSTPALTCCARKEKKKKKDKPKRGTLKLHKKEKRVDADKDIDETEVEQTTKEKKTRRKWF